MSEILPCGCDYEVISEKFGAFSVSNKILVEHTRDVVGRKRSFRMIFPQFLDMPESILTISLDRR